MKKTSAPTYEFQMAKAGNADRWVPANNGHEIPYVVNGVKVLYCWNFKQKKHAYLNMSSDMIMEDEEYHALVSPRKTGF